MFSFLLDFKAAVVEVGSIIADWLTPDLATKVAASWGHIETLHTLQVKNIWIRIKIKQDFYLVQRGRKGERKRNNFISQYYKYLEFLK
jgi:hypothetical protein